MHRPDFYICGGRYNDKAYLYASSTLDYVELQIEREFEESMFGGYVVSPDINCTLTAQSHDVVKVQGNDYKDAFNNLFGFWTPKGAESLGIEGVKKIGS